MTHHSHCYQAIVPPKGAEGIVLDSQPCTDSQDHHHHGRPGNHIDLGTAVIGRNNDLADIEAAIGSAQRDYHCVANMYYKSL